MVATHGDSIDMLEIAAPKHRNAGGAATAIDHDNALIRLILFENSETGRIGRGDDRLNLKMAAFDGKHQIAGCRRVGARHMHIHAQPVGDHAARLFHGGIAVEPVASWQRMKNRPARCDRMNRCGIHGPLDIPVLDRPPGGRDLRHEMLRADATARHGDDDALDRRARHPLGCIDCSPHHALGLVHVDDDAALEAARALVPNSQHAAAVRVPAHGFGGLHRLKSRDDAGDLGRADVEHGHDRTLACGKGAHLRRHAMREGAHARPFTFGRVFSK